MSDPRLVYMTDEAYRAAVCIHEAIQPTTWRASVIAENTFEVYFGS